ncbi:hypothetical protein NPIL_558761 [Nephila pilipes]|uniref:Uncharacterized protein n=1 Tax=Nephila pilipes TaxID=299642 RepID=A0A8X6JVY2_NEPPI|nr:hypothetical protein NPIL_558761 [Nephila pilipes]
MSNHVAIIQDLSCDEQWSHISSLDNLAGLISQDGNPSKVLVSYLWWVGPGFFNKQLISSKKYYSEYPQRDIPDNVIKDDVQYELKRGYEDNLSRNLDGHLLRTLSVYVTPDDSSDTCQR